MNLNRTLHYFIFFFCLLLTIPQPVESTEDWFTQGVAHLNAGRLDKAIEAFTRSIEMIPHDYEAYNNRGIAHSHKGEPSQAEIDFSKALGINPDFYNAYLNRGIARQKQGLYSSSLWDYAQAHRLKPDNQRPQVLIAWILATCPDVRLQNGRLAIKIIKGFSKYRSNTKLLSLLAAAHAATNDFDTAIDLQKKTLSILYKTRADSRQVELQQRHLERYQSGRPLQETILPPQNISNNEAKYIIAQLTQVFDKPKIITESTIDPAKKDTELIVESPSVASAKKEAELHVESPSVALVKKEAKLLAETHAKEHPAQAKETLPEKPSPEPVVALTKIEPTEITKAPSKEKSAQSGNISLKEIILEPSKKVTQGVQLSSLEWIFSQQETTPTRPNFPYVLVVGSFESTEKAFPVLEKLHQNGEPFFTSWVTNQSGQRWYQIYNGWYPDKTSAATAAVSFLKKHRFQSILVRKAPFTLWIQSNPLHPTLDSIKQRLDQLEIISYQIGNRLMVGAYRENKIDDISVIDALTAADLSFQLIAR